MEYHTPTMDVTAALKMVQNNNQRNILLVIELFFPSTAVLREPSSRPLSECKYY